MNSSVAGPRRRSRHRTGAGGLHRRAEARGSEHMAALRSAVQGRSIAAHHIAAAAARATLPSTLDVLDHRRCYTRCCSRRRRSGSAVVEIVRADDQRARQGARPSRAQKPTAVSSRSDYLTPSPLQSEVLDFPSQVATHPTENRTTGLSRRMTLAPQHNVAPNVGVVRSIARAPRLRHAHGALRRWAVEISHLPSSSTRPEHEGDGCIGPSRAPNRI